MDKMNIRKAAMIGCGFVGASSAFALMQSGIFSEMVMIDADHAKAEGEAMDLSHGLPFARPVKIYDGDYDDIVDAGIIIITAGANQKPGETRMDLTRKNIAVFRQIVPEVVKYAPHAILLVVTNPCDVLTYVTWKLSGLPANQVIGSGTVLDTSRLRYLLSQHTGVDPRNVHTYVLGEHGDTELPAWSLTSIAGMGMDEYCSLCASCQGSLSQTVRAEFDDKVRNAAYRIIEGKGATFYAVALAVRRIVEAILRDEQSILTVSSLLTGQYGLDGVCLSLPCIVGVNGVEQVLPIHLSDEEMAQLRISADAIRAAIRLMDEPVE